MPDEPAYKGKIGRLPLSVRNEVNRRLLENEPGPRILKWLNADPAVLEILDRYFHEQPISAQNLSEWRLGGYQDWLKRQEEVERLKDLSDYALRLGTAAGGNIADGSAAIAGGRLMAELEGLAGKELADAIYALSALRAGDLDKQRIGLAGQRLEQRERIVRLAEKKFQRDTCALFLKWAKDDRAKKIIESRASNSEKIEQLGQAIFGEDWE